MSKTFSEGFEDLFRGFAPDEWLRVGVPLLDPGGDVFCPVLQRFCGLRGTGVLPRHRNRGIGTELLDAIVVSDAERADGGVAGSACGATSLDRAGLRRRCVECRCCALCGCLGGVGGEMAWPVRRRGAVAVVTSRRCRIGRSVWQAWECGTQPRCVLPGVRLSVGSSAQPLPAVSVRCCGRRGRDRDLLAGTPVLLRQPGLRENDVRRAGSGPDHRSCPPDTAAARHAGAGRALARQPTRRAADPRPGRGGIPG